MRCNARVYFREQREKEKNTTWSVQIDLEKTPHSSELVRVNQRVLEMQTNSMRPPIDVEKHGVSIWSEEQQRLCNANAAEVKQIAKLIIK